MTRRARLVSLLALCLVASACGDDTGTGPDVDAGTGGDVDAGSGGGTDAGPGGDVDAGSGGEVDAGGDVDAGGAIDAGGATDAGPGGEVAPSAMGPFTVARSTTSVMRGSRTTPVTVHTPDVPAASAPLVLMMPGFQLNASNYTGTATYLASHGFVVVQADPSAGFVGSDHPAMAMDVMAVLDWALSAGGPAAFDRTNVGATGHSLGGKIATFTATMDPRIDALFGIDPVDGGGPGGPSPTTPDIVPSLVGGLTIPVGFLGETLDGTGGFMPCAPAAQNYTQFYEGCAAAVWAAEWTVPGANHVSFLDGDSLAGAFCQRATAPREVVLTQTRTTLVAFFRRHLRAESAMEAYLTGGSVAAGLVTRHRP